MTSCQPMIMIIELVFSLPGKGCGGLWHTGTLFLHGGWSRREEHVWPLSRTDGTSRNSVAFRQRQQNVPWHHWRSLPRICGQPTPGLQVRSFNLFSPMDLPAGVPEIPKTIKYVRCTKHIEYFHLIEWCSPNKCLVWCKFNEPLKCANSDWPICGILPQCGYLFFHT